MWYIFSVFSFSKCNLFHTSKVFGSCIIHILYAGCAKIKKKKNPAPKGYNMLHIAHIKFTVVWDPTKLTPMF